jgi:hypothetical protein
LNQFLLATLAQNRNLPLGSAILAAKSGVTDADVRRTWILFGDPSMRLQFSAEAPAMPMHTRPAKLTVDTDNQARRRPGSNVPN